MSGKGFWLSMETFPYKSANLPLQWQIHLTIIDYNPRQILHRDDAKQVTVYHYREMPDLGFFSKRQAFLDNLIVGAIDPILADDFSNTGFIE